MKDIINPVDTEDGLFHDGDPSTGAEGTIVYAKIMNAIQGGVIDIQTENKNILAEAQMTPDSSRSTQILDAIKKIITSSMSGIRDDFYPVGIVVWFAQSADPNQLFPGTTWKYIGENKTIRLASKDGKDVMTTGGSDSVTLAIENLPAHGHTFSANTSSFDYGTKGTSDVGDHIHSAWTDEQGNHAHTVPSSAGKGQGASGADSVQMSAGQMSTSTSGAHAHGVGIGGAGAHSHTVGIGAHSHSVSGTTANAGSGTEFSITNSFIKLMGWYRTA
ncbi:phage baseplate protein [Erwinia psidii]|uniref:phage baseplate protein n=1 Tax=Erwinia psidii TaxID=69224 RepID=UPI00226B3629|nr:phage tail protein [Erwinia psidii]